MALGPPAPPQHTVPPHVVADIPPAPHLCGLVQHVAPMYGVLLFILRLALAVNGPITIEQ